MSVDGILNMIKPCGKTSFEMVALVRQRSGERHVGHAGTLDYLASGVLPICLGKGTRMVEFLAEAPKIYWAEVELGIATDTYDAAGKVINRCDPSFVAKEDVERVLPSFCGGLDQCPPMYSAVKYRGRRLYQLARAGMEVERKARRVNIFHLELVDWQPPLVTVVVKCGKGTYIRSLAHDLGQTLGCGAHLRNLVRLKYGPFDAEDGITLPELDDAFRNGYWESLLYPIDAVLLHWKAAIVGGETGHLVRNGHSMWLKEDKADWSAIQSDFGRHNDDGEMCRAYTLDGRFLAVLRWETGRRLWHPDKVFPLSSIA